MTNLVRISEIAIYVPETDPKAMKIAKRIARALKRRKIYSQISDLNQLVNGETIQRYASLAQTAFPKTGPIMIAHGDNVDGNHSHEYIGTYWDLNDYLQVHKYKVMTLKQPVELELPKESLEPIFNPEVQIVDGKVSQITLTNSGGGYPEGGYHDTITQGEGITSNTVQIDEIADPGESSPTVEESELHKETEDTTHVDDSELNFGSMMQDDLEPIDSSPSRKLSNVAQTTLIAIVAILLTTVLYELFF